MFQNREIKMQRKYNVLQYFDTGIVSCSAVNVDRHLLVLIIVLTFIFDILLPVSCKCIPILIYDMKFFLVNDKLCIAD